MIAPLATVGILNLVYQPSEKPIPDILLVLTIIIMIAVMIGLYYIIDTCSDNYMTKIEDKRYTNKVELFEESLNNLPEKAYYKYKLRMVDEPMFDIDVEELQLHETTLGHIASINLTTGEYTAINSYGMRFKYLIDRIEETLNSTNSKTQPLNYQDTTIEIIENDELKMDIVVNNKLYTFITDTPYTTVNIY